MIRTEARCPKVITEGRRRVNQFQKIFVGPGVHKAESAAKHTQRWSALVARIRHQDGEALGELYATLRRTYPYYFCRKLGADHAADATHTIFLAAVGEIREGRLREPECLMAFVHAIARNYTCQQIGRKCRANETAFDDVFQLPDERKSIEQNVIAEERHQLVMECLGRLHPHHKEILVRFYLREESSTHSARNGLDSDAVSLTQVSRQITVRRNWAQEN